MKLRHIACLFLGMGVLVGCAGDVVRKHEQGDHSNYAEPPEEVPHAVLRVISDGLVRLVPDATCADLSKPGAGFAVSSDRLYQGAYGSNGQLRGVVGHGPPGVAQGEFRVAADRPLTLHYTYTWVAGGYEYACRIARTFTPQAQAHYEVMSLGQPKEKQCSLTAARLWPSAATLELSKATLCDK